MKSNYVQKKQLRIQRAITYALKNRKRSESAYNTAQKMADTIPTGQKILIGHHSEKADRRFRKKISNQYEKSIQTAEKAKYHERKVKTIEGNYAISSDDPEALEKLQKKLDLLNHRHIYMKSTNAAIRTNNKEAFVKIEGNTEKLWDRLQTFPLDDRLFEKFELSNSRCSIRLVEARIKNLKATQAMVTAEFEINGYLIRRNVEENRVQILFSYTPDKDLRQRLRKAGFVWAPSIMCAQRKLSIQAEYAAIEIVKKL